MTETADIVFVRGLPLSMLIGVEPHERGRRQGVVVSVRMEVGPCVRPWGGFVAYAPVVERLPALAASDEHVELVDTVAAMAARKALDDPGVRRVEVTVEKPDAVPEAERVGVTVPRKR